MFQVHPNLKTYFFIFHFGRWTNSDNERWGLKQSRGDLHCVAETVWEQHN
jgi:hypothetical protein